MKCTKALGLVSILGLACEPSSAAGQKAVGVAEVREAVASLPAGLQAPNRYALIVGAGEYADSRIPDLPACGNDARGLHAILIDPSVGMFPPENVTLLIDEAVTEDDVVEALDQLGRRAGPDDVVLVFFSGHGAVDSRGRAYWVMHDTKIDRLRSTGLAENEISDLLGDIQSSRLLTLIDACYSASTASLGDNKALLDVGKLYPQFDGKGRVAITASAGDQLSVVIPEGQDGHGYSAFAYHAIEGLKGAADGAAGDNREGVITVDELWGYVKDRTAATARRAGGKQQPQLKGQLGSRFLLTVDPERLVANKRDQQIANIQEENELAVLKRLAIEEKISPAIYELGLRLYQRGAAQLGQEEAAALDNFRQLCRQEISPQIFVSTLAVVAPSLVKPASIPLADQVASLLVKARSLRDARTTVEIEEFRLAIVAIEKIDSANPAIAQLKGRLDVARKRVAGLAKLNEINDVINQLDTASPDYALRKRKLLLDLKALGGLDSEDIEVLNRLSEKNQKKSSAGLRLLLIPAGAYLQGSPLSEKGRLIIESQKKAEVNNGFWIADREVTRKQWADVMHDSPQVAKPNYPVVNITWVDATAFCDRLTRLDRMAGVISNQSRYALPTETQWEYACRAGSTTAFSSGKSYDRLNEYGWHSKNSDTIIKNTATRLPNQWGLYDMHGNVQEWCRDVFVFGASRSANPVRKVPQYVVRGGAYSMHPLLCRSASRSAISREDSRQDLGFRVVLIKDKN